MPEHLSAPAWARELERRAEGPLFTAGRHGDEADYEGALRVYTASLPGRPDAVLRAASAADVSLAVTTAAAAGIPLSVRGGGHSGAGLSVASGGLMLDMGGLRGVRVEPAARAGGQTFAVAQPGATWGEYDRATQEHGLASTGGVVSSTGVAGLTLGGGIGALRGLYGLAVDNLVAADVVLADGSRVRADAEREPELYWALRGGGGNFGVVTGFHYAVHPVSGMTTGFLGWPLPSAPGLAAVFRKMAASGELPDRSVAEFIFTHAPTGEPTVLVTPRVIDGPGEDPLIPALRALAPAEDSVTARSYVEGQRFMDPLVGWGARHHWGTTTLRGLPEEVVAVLMEFTARAPSPRNGITVEHLHGAVSRRPAEETAVGFRHAPFNVLIEATWDAPGEDGANQAWVRELLAVLRPFGAGGAYANYLPRDATADELRAAYGEAGFARLRRAKAAYDPANVFRVNQNIPPGA
ncbi:FAD-binding oxidoreductase [Streptomyces sp. NPDC048172]|uniref:FAD-binding oxidoreductase n=1 Tax=Streptomyces sp. NPDC048172 TaxID=3365505 RepID=UPI003713AC46